MKPIKSSERVTNFKSQPFAYIPRKYLMYIRQHADLMDEDKVPDFIGKGGTISGPQRLLIEVITLENVLSIGTKQRLKHMGVITLIGKFLQSVAPDAFSLSFKQLQYPFSGATGVCALILEKAGIEYDVVDSILFFKDKDEAEVRKLIDPYMDYNLTKIETNNGTECSIEFVDAK